jgi:hypothetical protein
MVARAKRNNKRQALTKAARDWLDGKPCGFFKFKSQDELAALWAEHGDEDNMFWRSRYCLPITSEELEAREESWLNAADEEVHYRSLATSFINNNYTEDERQALWDELGDKSRFRFRRGMVWPAPIANDKCRPDFGK